MCLWFFCDHPRRLELCATVLSQGPYVDRGVTRVATTLRVSLADSKSHLNRSCCEPTRRLELDSGEHDARIRYEWAVRCFLISCRQAVKMTWIFKILLRSSVGRERTFSFPLWCGVGERTMNGLRYHDVTSSASSKLRDGHETDVGQPIRVVEVEDDGVGQQDRLGTYLTRR